MTDAERQAEREDVGFKMDVKLVSNQKQRLVFELAGSSPGYANALRRLIVDEVPTLAIDDIEFFANNSILYDEYLALRLGLLPLVTDLESYNLKDECKCKGAGCAQCELTVTLEGKGPGMVYSKDVTTKDPKVKVVEEKVPIVNLLKGQNVKLTATAILGKGKEHQKWSPGYVYYKYMPKITIKNVKDAEKVAQSCPADVYEVKAGKLVVKDLMACHLCNACVEVSEGLVDVVGDDTSFVVTVESFGQLKTQEMVIKATEILDSKLDEFSKSIK